MTRTIITAILFFLGRSAIGQKGIDNLIKAEKDFAAYAVAHSTKEAFQQFIDSNSIMFDEGKPISAIEYWNKREKRPGVLKWHPQYAEISASGDFGYTTGPWTFQRSPADSVIARGQYSTVWRLNEKGEWKFVVDFGIDNSQPGSEEERIIDTPKEADDAKTMTAIGPLVSVDHSFNQLLEENRSKAYKEWLSRESILTRNGSLPATTATARQVVIDATPADARYKTSGWGISLVPDMGYTYGTAMIKDKEHNYLRIWRREKQGWRIALEVFRY
ncbi:MAG TPA: DUF4440 domain-containing protein [Chitinophagaceae bacterium]|nr:DUF4440 domain-containing protein [Chitinophagaceae bacterium]